MFLSITNVQKINDPKCHTEDIPAFLLFLSCNSKVIINKS